MKTTTRVAGFFCLSLILTATSATAAPRIFPITPVSPGILIALTDDDGDGYGDARDCDDTDAAINPSATEIQDDGIDQDCDGSDLTDQDGDGYTSDSDCNDLVAAVYPGASETPDDGIDQDCDGADATAEEVDEDADGDGSSASEDCDDADAAVSPDAEEVCEDGVDNDCDGDTDETEEYPAEYLADDDGDGATEADGDCDDAEASVNPATDGLICDYAMVEACTYADEDGDGFAADDDCDDADATVNPDAEEITGDGTDQNCDGSDEEALCLSVATTYYEDADGDGFGNADSEYVTSDSCDEVPDGFVTDDTDCDDTDSGINPDAEDASADGVDQDCDGVDFSVSDEAEEGSSSSCALSLGAGDAQGLWLAFAGLFGALFGLRKKIS